MNAPAHSSLSRVLTDWKASSTSVGSRPIMGYMPFCARLTASTLISSMVRSGRSCANAGVESKAVKTHAPAATDKRPSTVCIFIMSLVPFFGDLDFVASLFAELREPAESLPRPGTASARNAATLENELQSQLHGPASTRSDDRVRRRYVRSRARAAETSRARHRWIVVSPTILTAEWIGKVRMIEHVEEFSADLHPHAFTEAEVLHDREVHVPETEITKRVAAHAAEGPGRRRSHHRFAFRIATPVGQLVRGRLAASRGDAGRRRCGRAWGHADHVPSSVGYKVRIADPWDTGGLGGLKIRRVAGEIPAIHALARQAEIGSGVDDT